MKKELLALISNSGGYVTAKKYFSNVEAAMKWAQRQAGLENYEIAIYRFADERLVLHYGFQSIWSCQKEER